MKVIGLLTIHYGKEYLKECLTSVKNHCEKVVVAYTEKPSHGFGTTETCPDSKSDIKLICEQVLGDKLIFDVVEYGAENQHRNHIRQYSNGYDLVLTIDADEVFEPSELTNALEYAYNNPQRYYGIKGYINFWRSFNYACYDGFRPIRIENLAANNNDQNHECPLTIYHFSTAQSEPVMRYKYKIFGHASEIKPDWLNSIHYAWTPQNQLQDLHPVSYNLWNAVPYAKHNMPEFLKQHPNFNKELI
jgi:hypothetical protein